MNTRIVVETIRTGIMFSMKKNKKFFFFSLSLTYTWHSGHAINIHWMLDFLIRTFRLSYQFVLIFVFIALVDFNSNTNNKTTPFSHHLFSTNSFLNYSKSDRRTSSPIEHHHQQEIEEEEVEEEEEDNNDEIGTDENDDDLDEDSCNR